MSSIMYRLLRQSVSYQDRSGLYRRLPQMKLTVSHRGGECPPNPAHSPVFLRTVVMSGCCRFVAFALSLLVCSAVVRAVDKVDFQREIRPILADKCFACHGSDAEHREG